MNEYRFANICMNQLGFMPKIKSIPAVGRVSRFKDETKRKSNIDCWILNIDNNIFSIGSWYSNITFTYIDNKFEVEKLSKQEKEQLRIKCREARILADKEREQEYIQAGKKASKEFMQMLKADKNHKYLTNKKIKLHGDIRQSGDKLIIPIFNSYSGEIQSYQSIDSDGNKRFLFGAKKAGGCYPLNDIDNLQLYILCEGYATASSILEYYDKLINSTDDQSHNKIKSDTVVICCFDAGNLITVAKNIRSKDFGTPIEIWADKDKSRVGIDKANQVKSLVKNVSVNYPRFDEDEIKKGLSDFNDYINSRGLLL